MLRRIIVMLFLLAVVNATVQAEWLRIYHVGVGHGDLTVIVIKKQSTSSLANSCLIIIDSGPGPGSVTLKIQKKTVKPEDIWKAITDIQDDVNVHKVDYFIASHLHDDHIGSAHWILNRIRAQAGAGPLTTRVVDRDQYVGPRTWRYGRRFKVGGKIVERYRNQRDGKGKSGTGIAFPQPSVQVGTDLLQGFPFTDVKLRCIAANGVIPTAANRWRDIDNANMENATSYAFLLEFGKFRYYTGGDLDGEDESRKRVDQETELMTYLPTLGISNFHVCAMKLNHHGSAYSNKMPFIRFLRPTAIVVTAGLCKFGGGRLPRLETFNNIKTALEPTPPATPAFRLFYTYVPFGLGAGDERDLRYFGIDPPSTPPPTTYNVHAVSYKDVAITLTSTPSGAGPITFSVQQYPRTMKRLTRGTAEPAQPVACPGPH